MDTIKIKQTIMAFLNKLKSKRKLFVVLGIFLGISITLYVFVYKTLQNGIYVNTANIGGVKIDGFYLKLNNKLDLKISSLDLKEFLAKDSDTTMNADDINDIINYSLRAISYFDSFDISKIDIGDEDINYIKYNGERYLIKLSQIYADLSIEQDEDKIMTLNINQAYLPKIQLAIDGMLVYKKKEIDFELSFTPLIKDFTDKQSFIQSKSQNTLSLNGHSDFKILQLNIGKTEVDSLNDFRKYIEMVESNTLNEWLFDNIAFDKLVLEKASVALDLDADRLMDSLKNTLEIQAHLENPKVKLYKNMTDLIYAQKVKAELKKDNLVIGFDAARLGEIALSSSEVHLNNIISQPLNPVIKINSNNASLNKATQGILEHYGITIPLTQKDSTLAVQLDIDIRFDQGYKNQDVFINGFIRSGSAFFNVGDKTFYSKLLDINFTSNDKQKIMDIKNFDIVFADMFVGSISGKMDLSRSVMNGAVNVKYANITMPKINNLSKTKIPDKIISTTDEEQVQNIIDRINQDNQGLSVALFDMTDKNIEFSLNLKHDNDKKLLNIGSFGTSVLIDKATTISVKDISLIYPYAPILEYFDVKNGSVSLRTSDFSVFSLEASASNLNYPIYDKNNHKITNLSVSGIIDPKQVNIESKDKKIALNQKNNRLKITLKDYDVNVDEILESKIPIIMAINSDSKQKSLSREERIKEAEFLREKRRFERLNKIKPNVIYVEATNLGVYFAGYKIPTHKINIDMRDGIVRASGEYGNGIATVDISNGRSAINMNNFSSDFINSILKQNTFEGGLFSFKGIMANKELRGIATLQNTVFKNFAIVQNVLGLIDAVPSLIVFKKPGLNKDGYEIKKGTILLGTSKTHLGLEDIDLVGSSIDIKGNGIIELESKNINILLQANTIKSISDILSKIPVVGYLVLGEEGKISTNIILEGTLEHPKSKISLIEDVINAPFKILRRAFSPINVLVDTIKNN